MAMCQDLWPAHWAMTESKIPADIARLLGDAVHALSPPAHCTVQQLHAARQPAVADRAGALHPRQRAAAQQPGLPAAGWGGDEHALDASGAATPQETSAQTQRAAAAGPSDPVAMGGCPPCAAAPDQASCDEASHQAARTVMQSTRLRSKDSAQGKGLAGGNRLEIQVDAGSSAILRSPTRARPVPGSSAGQAKENDAAEACNDAHDGRAAALQRPTGSDPASAPGPPRDSQEADAEVTHPATLLAHS